MNSKELSQAIRESGVVGAGGAGFPTYIKMDERANTIIMNCAECEPLIKLHRQLLELYPYEIMKTLSLIAELVQAEEAVIGIKKEYKATIDALYDCIDDFPKIRIHMLDSVYPMGDELVLIYETTHKVVKPGHLPIEEGIAVFNVETIYNIYKTIDEKKPVTDKVVSIIGEVTNPITVRVPLGSTIKEVVALAGAVTTKEPSYLIGGPMMGTIGVEITPITKTTNAILVLPKDHYLINKKKSNVKIEIKRAASICCQCQMCTDLCPRQGLGHPVEPHLFMRAIANADTQNIKPFLNSLLCSSCGVCELYSCPQGLSPRSLMGECKTKLRQEGVKVPRDIEPNPIQEARAYRKIPEERLEARLGLQQYDVEAPLSDEVVSMEKVKLLLNQHIGVPAQAIVSKGDIVEVGQMIAKPSDGLSVAIHSSISGKVVVVTKTYIVIQKSK